MASTKNDQFFDPHLNPTIRKKAQFFQIKKRYFIVKMSFHYHDEAVLCKFYITYTKACQSNKKMY